MRAHHSLNASAELWPYYLFNFDLVILSIGFRLTWFPKKYYFHSVLRKLYLTNCLILYFGLAAALCLAPFFRNTLMCSLGQCHTSCIFLTGKSSLRSICLFSPDDITMVICPGIGNHSEKHYIRTFVDHAQRDGYRCAVLNHLGALPNIELTSPRMFTYGETEELTSVLLLLLRE